MLQPFFCPIYCSVAAYATTDSSVSFFTRIYCADGSSALANNMQTLPSRSFHSFGGHTCRDPSTGGTASRCNRSRFVGDRIHFSKFHEARQRSSGTTEISQTMQRSFYRWGTRLGRDDLAVVFGAADIAAGRRHWCTWVLQRSTAVAIQYRCSCDSAIEFFDYDTPERHLHICLDSRLVERHDEVQGTTDQVFLHRC